MGDVLMIKNDSGIKSATGLTGSGSRDWIIQRISAVVLAVYSVVLLGFFLTHGDVTYLEWFMQYASYASCNAHAMFMLCACHFYAMLTLFSCYCLPSQS